MTVSADTVDDNRVRLTVSDQGEGVPEHFVPRLFQRFSQAESHTDRARAGTGLGLAICRELATLMEGEVGYYFDGGAHFWVEFPLMQPTRENDRANASFATQ
ncbi:ATP-binding protein [Marinobacter koreensis]|uniref:ATP-binding protein n=1 Tax=Marinobacter koreensis TaxID=335974 RepID=UPI00360C34D3